MDDSPRIFRVFRVLPGQIDTTLAAQEIITFALFSEDTTAEYDWTRPTGMVRIYQGDEEIRSIEWSVETIRGAIEKKEDTFHIVVSRARTDAREGRGRIWTVDRITKPDCGLALGFVEVAGDETIEIPPWATEELTGDFRYTTINLLRRYRKLLGLDGR